MALNKFMHPRNPYKSKKANFQSLAIKYPGFRKHVFPDVSGKLFLDFTNPESLRQLSTTLMKEDFGLDVELPPDRLVPTIPLRLNYILWIEDILNKSKISGQISGIDIGTGGSCVYPLLSARMYKWKFLATEVDETNYEYALKNINKNSYAEIIKVVKVVESAILLDVLTDSSDTYQFCMCNPPFFSDHLEAQGITNSRTDDRPEPHSVNTASETESVAFGGEVEFVKKMIHESLELKSKVRVFTSMVGKKSSLVPIKEELRKHEITNFSTTEFCQGKTMRWGIGWAFDDDVKFPKSQFREKRKDKRPPLTYIVPEETPNLMYTTEGVAYQLKELLKQLEMKCVDKKSTEVKIAMVISAQKNTWSHQRRKRRQQNLEGKIEDDINKNRNNIQENGDTGCKKRKVSGENDTVLQSKSPVKKSEQDDTGGDHYQSQSIMGNGSQATGSRKRRHSGDTCADKVDSDRLKGSKVPKMEEEIKSNVNVEQNTHSNSDSAMEASDLETLNKGHKKDKIDQKHLEKSVSLTETNSDSEHKNAEKSENFENSASNDNQCILKCNLWVKQMEDEKIAIEMGWIEGTCRESMNQVLQYFKNQLQKNKSTLSTGKT